METRYNDNEVLRIRPNFLPIRNLINSAATTLEDKDNPRYGFYFLSENNLQVLEDLLIQYESCVEAARITDIQEMRLLRDEARVAVNIVTFNKHNSNNQAVYDIYVRLLTTLKKNEQKYHWYASCRDLFMVDIWQHVNRQDLPEAKKKKLSQLQDEWLPQALIGHFSSSTLSLIITILSELKTYLHLARQELLQLVSEENHEMFTCIEAYLESLKNNITAVDQIYKPAILLRLQAASEQHDLQFDDAIVYLIGQLKHHLGNNASFLDNLFEPLDTFLPSRELDQERFNQFHDYLYLYGELEDKKKLGNLAWFKVIGNNGFKVSYQILKSENTVAVLPQTSHQPSVTKLDCPSVHTIAQFNTAIYFIVDRVMQMKQTVISLADEHDLNNELAEATRALAMLLPLVKEPRSIWHACCRDQVNNLLSYIESLLAEANTTDCRYHDALPIMITIAKLIKLVKQTFPYLSLAQYENVHQYHQALSKQENEREEEAPTLEISIGDKVEKLWLEEAKEIFQAIQGSCIKIYEIISLEPSGQTFIEAFMNENIEAALYLDLWPLLNDNDNHNYAYRVFFLHENLQKLARLLTLIQNEMSELAQSTSTKETNDLIRRIKSFCAYVNKQSRLYSLRVQQLQVNAEAINLENLYSQEAFSQNKAWSPYLLPVLGVGGFALISGFTYLYFNQPKAAFEEGLDGASIDPVVMKLPRLGGAILGLAGTLGFGLAKSDFIKPSTITEQAKTIATKPHKNKKIKKNLQRTNEQMQLAICYTEEFSKFSQHSSKPTPTTRQVKDAFKLLPGMGLLAFSAHQRQDAAQQNIAELSNDATTRKRPE